VRILLTGASGFIGAHLYRELSDQESIAVLGIDSHSNYYSPHLKKLRFESLSGRSLGEIRNVDISKDNQLDALFQEFEPDIVIHLAAQAGVRLTAKYFDQYSLSNLTGFTNVITACVKFDVQSILYASSSSVYGDKAELPLRESERNLAPTSLYGATKLSNELIAATISRRYGLKTRGLRFFTVYGPWGRPDMAYFRILSALLHGDSFRLNGDGEVRRDFTFIDDVISLVEILAEDLIKKDTGYYDVVNLGGGTPYSIIELIQMLETITGRSLHLIKQVSESSDVYLTHSNSDYRQSLIGQSSFIPLVSGLTRFVEWGSDTSIRSYLQDWVKSSEAWTT
jgi:UDP-glucuronate 4-epimerase